MDFRKWTIAQYDKQIAKMLADECDADPFLALIASSRGYTDPYEFEEFISDDLVLCSPFEFSQMPVAVQRIKAAIEQKEKITVFGDYDCDGISASAVLYLYLTSCGANVDCHIPDRLSEGYGLNADAIAAVAESGTKLIITVDNGINSLREVDVANSLGLDVIVTDHHLPTGQNPNAIAVIDPYSDENYSAFKALSGVGVAFMLVCALEGADPEEMLPKYADLVCLGTIADVMPLIRENRAIVKAGLPLIRDFNNLGIKALLDVSGNKDKEVTATSVSFMLAPRINAAGRMGSAKDAFDLLICTDKTEAYSLAEKINNLNTLRQNTEQQITAEAVQIIEQNRLATDKIIVVSGRGWHKGVTGICAARLCEKYKRPVIVFSSDDTFAVGSARSVKDFSIFDAICTVKDMTLKFGGHEQAAGLTINADLVDQFREKINQNCSHMPLPVPELTLDCKLKISAINFDLAEVIETLAPFGAGNPMPIFGVYGATLDRITPVGNGKHLRLLFKKELSVLSGIMFSTNEHSLGFAVGDTVDIAVVVGTNYYNGEKQLSVQIKAIKAAGSDGEKAYREKEIYDRYVLGKLSDKSLAHITREDVGTVFRSIDRPITLKRLVNELLNTISCTKILLAVDILRELQFIKITKKDDVTFIERVLSAHKNDISNSPTYRDLRGE
ncbi:MAG: single-stranded-DNA-specific exonuclease RecJ [Clostridia bacterium]|nr:single-stranded-DNA-specific exonuclease RecJ [Clostridia bacterium]